MFHRAGYGMKGNMLPYFGDLRAELYSGRLAPQSLFLSF